MVVPGDVWCCRAVQGRKRNIINFFFGSFFFFPICCIKSQEALFGLKELISCQDDLSYLRFFLGGGCFSFLGGFFFTKENVEPGGR